MTQGFLLKYVYQIKIWFSGSYHCFECMNDNVSSPPCDTLHGVSMKSTMNLLNSDFEKYSFTINIHILDHKKNAHILFEIRINQT